MESKLQEVVLEVPDHADTLEMENLIRQRCIKFNQWCKDVGILHPKITYPAFFEGGLVGCMVNSPIEHREAFLFVPFSATISVEKCLNDPVLGEFFQ
jgi:hypothetical protein